MCKNDDILQKVIETEKTNMEEHNELREAIKEMHNNAIDATKVIAKSVSEIKANMVDKKDLEIVKEIANSAKGGTSLTWKIVAVIFVLFAGISGYFQSRSAFYQKQNYENAIKNEKEKGEIFALVKEISKTLKDQQGKILYIDDTLTNTIGQINKFYTTEWKTHLIHDKRLRDSVTHNWKELGTHEKRIEKLESIIK